MNTTQHHLKIGNRFSVLTAALGVMLLLLNLSSCGNKGDLFQTLDKDSQAQLDQAELELDAAAKKKKKK